MRRVWERRPSRTRHGGPSARGRSGAADMFGGMINGKGFAGTIAGRPGTRANGMMAMKPHDEVVDHLLGELEAPIMRMMWERGSASVREILSALNDDQRRHLAYTTVMTVMSRLTDKGLLSRERRGKMHVYRPTATRDGFLRHAAARRVQELVAEFGDFAVAQFLAEVTELTPERRRQLEQLVEEGA